MTEFKLDQRLQADCHLLHETGLFSYLLHKNAAVTWFILVPHVEQTELYQLESAVQNILYPEINRVSSFVDSRFPVDKINVASIGNVVAQMHIHIIGRRRDDDYWPDVVWGKALEKTYPAAQVDAIRKKFNVFLQTD